MTNLEGKEYSKQSEIVKYNSEKSIMKEKLAIMVKRRYIFIYVLNIIQLVGN
jgi:hypothetical protein